MTKSFLPPENERMFPQKDDRVKRKTFTPSVRFPGGTSVQGSYPLLKTNSQFTPENSNGFSVDDSCPLECKRPIFRGKFAV